MRNKIWRVIGLMSGTSLDGVDLVYVKIIKNNNYSFEILEKKTINYSEKWKIKLHNAFNFTGNDLAKLDVDYGSYLAKLIRNFIVENSVENVDFISSHGHTIFHRPELNYTKQIGSGAVISALTNIKVICDFRVQDIALGGQGAPLVPIGDMLLFGTYKYCLNLGGFANISYQKNKERIAFDICPVNIVLNHYSKKMGLEYDDKGDLAAKGNIHVELLKELNNLHFYGKEKPKSLGFEFVNEIVFPLVDNYKLQVKDVLRTFIEHVVFQIFTVIDRNKDGEVKDEESMVLVTGGGVFNKFLMRRLNEYLSNKVIIPNKDIIDFKEALIFALLGVLKDENSVNCLQSVTGAMKNHSSGVVYEV